MNTTNSSVKKRLNIVPYTVKTSKPIYLKINFDFLNSFKLTSPSIAHGLELIVRNFNEQQQYSSQLLANSVSDALISMISSMENSSSVNTACKLISDIATECLNIISTINFESLIPEHKLNDLSENTQSLYNYFVNTYNIDTLNESTNININLYSSTGESTSNKSKTDILQIINLLMYLLSFAYQIISNSSDSRYKEQLINQNNQFIQDVANIDSSIKDISKSLKRP